MSELKRLGWGNPSFAFCTGYFLFLVVRKQVNEDCVMPVPPPKMKADSQLTLPLDINNYPMAKYVQLHFKVRVTMLGLMM